MLPQGIELEFKRHCQLNFNGAQPWYSELILTHLIKWYLSQKKEKLSNSIFLVRFEDRIQDRSNGSCNKIPIRIKQSTSIKGERKEEIEN